VGHDAEPGSGHAHGEEHRRRIGLTIGREAIDESTFSASPVGVVARVKEKVGIGGNGDDPGAA